MVISLYSVISCRYHIQSLRFLVLDVCIWIPKYERPVNPEIVRAVVVYLVFPIVYYNCHYLIHVLSPVSLHLSKKQPVSSMWSYLSHVMHSGFHSLLFWMGSHNESRIPFHIASSRSSIAYSFKP